MRWIYICIICLFATWQSQAQFDVPPLFEGCDDPLISLEQRINCSQQKLLEYIAKKMNYPDSSAARQVEGVVVLRFTVDALGAVTMVELLNGLDKPCNEEALRLMRSLPKFTAAQKDNQPVEAHLTIPIRFALKDLLHHASEDLYRIHWAKVVSDSISRKEWQEMLKEMPFVRDAKGLNYRIEKLEITYIKGKKLATQEQSDPETWSESMLELLQKARSGGIYMLRANITDQFKTIEVIREFYLE